MGSYCWWLRNPANQLRLVVFPIIYRFIGFQHHPRWLFGISAINSLTYHHILPDVFWLKRSALLCRFYSLVLDGIQYTPLKPKHDIGKIPICNSRYIFKWLEFSICHVSFRGVVHWMSLKTATSYQVRGRRGKPRNGKLQCHSLSNKNRQKAADDS